MADVRFEMKIGGIRSMLKSPPVVKAVKKATRKVAKRANAMAPRKHGYKAKPYGLYVDEGGYTVIGKVVALTSMAKRDNEKNETLIKALGGGR